VREADARAPFDHGGRAVRGAGRPCRKPAGHAKRNYDMLMRRQKQVGDLPPVERAEVARLDQLLRA